MDELEFMEAPNSPKAIVKRIAKGAVALLISACLLVFVLAFVHLKLDKPFELTLTVSIYIISVLLISYAAYMFMQRAHIDKGMDDKKYNETVKKHDEKLEEFRKRKVLHYMDDFLSDYAIKSCQLRKKHILNGAGLDENPDLTKVVHKYQKRAIRKAERARPHMINPDKLKISVSDSDGYYRSGTCKNPAKQRIIRTMIAIVPSIVTAFLSYTLATFQIELVSVITGMITGAIQAFWVALRGWKGAKDGDKYVSDMIAYLNYHITKYDEFDEWLSEKSL